MAANAMEFFLQRHNQRKVDLLERNHSIAEFLDGVIDHLVTFCNQESIPIENIEIRDFFIAADTHMNARIVWRR